MIRPREIDATSARRTVVVMTHDYPPLSGGGLALGVRELAELLELDHDVLVLSSRLRDHFADDRRTLLDASAAGGTACAKATAVRTIRSLARADVLIAHWTFSFRRLATLSVILGPLLGTPTVCVIHTAPGHCDHNRLRRLPGWARAALVRLAGRTMRRCAAVVALGQSHVDELTTAGVPVTHVLPLPVSMASGNAVGPARQPDAPVPTIGIAGELSTLKGSDRLPAFLPALAPEFAIRIAGAGPLTGLLADVVDHLPAELRGRVRMLGRVEPARMAQFYRTIDFLLVPSRTEAQPRVVLEAMLAGVVVVACRATGVVDLLSDGVTGVLIDNADPGSCRRRLAELVGDPALATAIRDRAFVFASAQLHRASAGWPRLLADLLDGRI